MNYTKLSLSIGIFLIGVIGLSIQPTQSIYGFIIGLGLGLF